MTDIELLRWAADAVGIRYTVRSEECYKTAKFFGLWLVYDHEPSEYTRRHWNPLTDDGDALRLAVKLGIDPEWGGFDLEICKTASGARTFCYVEPHGNDPYAATRRAIVRAAAEIGKSIK